MHTPRLFLLLSVAAVVCFGCSSDDSYEPGGPTTSIASSAVSPSVPTTVAPSPTDAREVLPAPEPLPEAAPVTFQCGDFSLYQSGTALYSDGTTGYEAVCDTFVVPTPELRYCDYGGTAVYTDGSYIVNDPACADTAPPSSTGYPYHESEDRNGDGVVNGYERCGVLCGEEPTSGDIQTQYGCEQGYIVGPQCE